MKVALIGIGKIARDQHVPSIVASEDWDLAATVSRAGTVDGVPSFTSLDEMLAAHPDVDTVSLCMPPVPRYDYAKACIAAGRNVMLEKPPGATLAEVQALSSLAADGGVSLYATWHSRMAKGVAAARAALAGKRVTQGHIDWKENVRQWHPGQDWVFEPGGMGVFDPGINALSILTEILPDPVFLRSAVVRTPDNRQTPIAAELTFSDGVTASFDWLKEGEQLWEMTVQTNCGSEVALTEGGNVCHVDGLESPVSALGEYPALYARMADLVREKNSDVDLAPMVHVSDAMTLGRREVAAPFKW